MMTWAGRSFLQKAASVATQRRAVSQSSSFVIFPARRLEASRSFFGSKLRQRRRLSCSIVFQSKMASDDEDDYMAFLYRANRDFRDGRALAQQQSEDGTVSKDKDEGVEVPASIRRVCERTIYVTDADEPFEEVGIKWDKDSLPDEDEFEQLIDHWDRQEPQISILDPMDWDPRGKYTKVIEAVREATEGNDVRVYCVVRDTTRSEYWVVSRAPGKIVGVKALGVES